MKTQNLTTAPTWVKTRAVEPVQMPARSLGRKILVGLLWAIAAIAILITAVPLVLVFITTSVPIIISIILALADIGLLIALFRFDRTPLLIGGVALGLIAVSLLAVVASQFFAATAPIVDAQGKPLPNSIAVLEKVKINGTEQWITIRGKDQTKPVLLYLGIGGPGAGGFPATFTTLAPLEDHFVVVNWDQPGTGKSYDAVSIPSLTVDRFIEDARELTLQLRARFHQEKIYLLGLSWGTILGTQLVQRYPELYYAYAGNGQMVNTTENDQLGYELAIKIAAERGQNGTVESLRRNGPPPYQGGGLALKYAEYNNILFEYMDSPRLELVLTLVPQFAKEYGLLDRVNFARGLYESFTVLYPQLRDLDFTTQANKLQVPMYFLVGHADVNAMASLVERYYNSLDAPYKELIWLESGHGAGREETLDAMVNHVLVHSPPTR